MEVPAGFRQTSNHARQIRSYNSLKHNTDLSSQEILPPATQDVDDSLISSLGNLDLQQELISQHSISPDAHSSVAGNVPIIPSVDKPSSSLPHVITMTEDYLCSSLGFRHIDTIKQHLPDLYCKSDRLDTSPPDAVLDQGDFATIRKSARNTTPVPRSSCFGNAMHMDIVFGPEVALGDIHYALLISDQYSWMNYIYPLHNLTSDIPKQLQAFFAHLGFHLKCLISDFDLKLIGGKAREYLNSLLIHVNAATSSHQDRNGLVERHWQTMLAMA
jgi:hypothetical protein